MAKNTTNTKEKENPMGTFVNKLTAWTKRKYAKTNRNDIKK